MPPAVASIAAHFAVEGELAAAEAFGRGHINESHLLTYRSGGATARFLLQRLNATVFKNPALVMENVQRVTAHVAGKLKSQGVNDIGRRVLKLVPTHAHGPYYRDGAGCYWRLYQFIEGALVQEIVATPEQAYQAGQAFGLFQHLLADLPGPRLHETIPDFHSTPLRFAALERVVQFDPYHRAGAARAEIELARAHHGLADVLVAAQRRGELPERVVHNDAKISNVLFDAASGAALCVVDLDTVMPGLAPYDFGDMVRSMTSTAAEDEADLSKVRVQMDLFEGLARGYLETAGAFLTPLEREQLVFAGRLITLEQGVRFLTDYLDGDRYYKISRPAHNLERCRNQFRLFEALTQHEVQMLRILQHL